MKIRKWLKQALCSHPSLRFCASTGAWHDRSGGNVDVGVTALCNRCQRAWTGDVKAAVSRDVAIQRDRTRHVALLRPHDAWTVGDETFTVLSVGSGALALASSAPRLLDTLCCCTNGPTIGEHVRLVGVCPAPRAPGDDAP